MSASEKGRETAKEAKGEEVENNAEAILNEICLVFEEGEGRGSEVDGDDVKTIG